jgi:uncharacterized protein YodC (DUF2158 family)
MFHEQLNADGSIDLLCLACRALVGENLSPANLPLVREAHKCNADESLLLPLTRKRNIAAENHKEIREGDVVWLRSGGPQMTVLKLDGDGAVCSWLVGSQAQIAWVSFATAVQIKRSPLVFFGHGCRKLLLIGAELLRRWQVLVRKRQTRYQLR